MKPASDRIEKGRPVWCYKCLKRVYPRKVAGVWVIEDEDGTEHRCERIDTSESQA